VQAGGAGPGSRRMAVGRLAGAARGMRKGENAEAVARRRVGCTQDALMRGWRGGGQRPALGRTPQAARFACTVRSRAWPWGRVAMAALVTALRHTDVHCPTDEHGPARFKGIGCGERRSNSNSLAVIAIYSLAHHLCSTIRVRCEMPVGYVPRIQYTPT
jgi:hypothetical protein